MRLLPNGIKIGNATVVVDIIPRTNPEIRPGGSMNPSYITDHDTGNAGRGADAEMHNRYIHNMASYHPRDTSHVSWHLTVDENFIYQHIPFDEPAYHCGDGFGILSGNRTSIGVEKCMNVDGDRAQTEENAIALHVYLLKNVIKKTPNNVVPHQHWSGKYCPAVILRRDGSFIPFRNRIQSAYSGTTSTYIPPKKQTGSELINKPSDKSISQMANEVIAGKHGSGHSNRRKSLGISQSEYEKVRSEVNRRSGLTNKTTSNPKASKPAPKPTPKKSNLPNATYYVKSPQFNGSGVRAVQEALASVYFYPEKGAKNNGIDGYYGPKTADAVRRFQSMHGLVADGSYGPKTKAALEKAIK